MRCFFYILVLLCFFPGPVSAAAADPLQPAKPWILDYGETRCSATRNYGTDQKPVLFGIRPSPQGNLTQIILMRPGRVGDAEHVPISVRFAGHDLKTTALRYQPEDKKFEVLRADFAREAVAPISAASSVEIEARGGIDGNFAIPDIAEVMKALDVCNRDLQEYWNIGEERQSRLKSQATAVKPLSSYFDSDDYPGQAAMANQDGRVRMMLMVDEKGALKDCAVEESSGIASLDAQACAKLYTQAKFTPAADASGKPVRSAHTVTVVWKLQ